MPLQLPSTVEKMPASIEKRKLNWLLWSGFLTAAIAFVSYFLFFYQFPITRDFPWVNYLLFALGAGFLAIGLQRAFAHPSAYRGKVAGPILAVLSAAVLGAFCYVVFIESKALPSASDAVRVGQKAPDFLLSDTGGKPVSLAALLSSPIGGKSGSAHAPRGVLLIFYRGY
jgi:hypothetical protein